MRLPVRAVTFDYWSTLVVPPEKFGRRRRDRWVRILGAAGEARSAAKVDSALTSALETFDRAWVANEQMSVHDATAFALGHLSLNPGPALRDELAQALADPGDVELTPGCAEMLRVLDAAGIRLGVICDVRFTPSTMLREVLRRHSVLSHFDHFSFSDEVGRFKPAPEIFKHALDGLGVDPEESIHVGDLRRTDVAGARAIGMASVRYAGVDDDTSDLPEADWVLRDHCDLPALISADAATPTG